MVHLLTKRFFSNSALLRNIGIVAHIDAGKTTMTERFINKTGLTKRVGSVDVGDTIMDYLPEERERGITISSAAITLPWKGHRLNLIDTPGHVDFTVEVERSLRVMDGAVVILDASKGIQAQTLTVWRQARENGLKCIIFLNKTDKIGANVEKCLKDIKQRFGLEPILLNEPIYEKDNLTGLKDFDMLASEFEEKVAQFDEIIFEKYLEKTPIGADEIKNGLRRITESGKEAVIVLSGSAGKDFGIEKVLDGIVDFLPEPSISVIGDSKIFKALAFKVIYDTKRKGFLVYCRVYSGNLDGLKRPVLHNLSTGKREQVAKIMQAMADELVEVEVAQEGQIVILTGLKNTSTGDTLCTDSRESSLKGIDIPSPVISTSFETDSVTSQDHLEECLKILQLEDPSVKTYKDAQTGELILSGMGELHLEILQSKLRREMGAEFTAGPVKISFQEALIDGFGQMKTTHSIDKDVFGVKLCGSVELVVMETGDDFEIDIEGKHESAIREAVIDALNGALSRGPIEGHRVCKTFKIQIRNLHCSSVSSAHAVVFEALEKLLIEAKSKGLLVLQEPVVKVEIEAPLEFIGDLTADLYSQRGCVEFESFEDGRIVAKAVLRRMLGYSTWLRSKTGGMAAFTMEPAGYTDVISGPL